MIVIIFLTCFLEVLCACFLYIHTVYVGIREVACLPPVKMMTEYNAATNQILRHCMTHENAVSPVAPLIHVHV